MAHVYSLSNGIDEVIFNGPPPTGTAADPFQTLRWLMQTPNPSQLPQAAEGSDFAPAAWHYTHVTETLEFRIFDAPTGENPQYHVRRIQTLIDQAQRRQRSGGGPRVYLQADMENAEGVWRSELLAGRLLLPNGLEQWQRTGQIDAQLSYTRRYYWEEILPTDPEPIWLTSSEDTAGADTGVDVYNNDDATPAATNYVYFGVPEGVVPTPMRLNIINAGVSAYEWRDIFLCNWVRDYNTNIDPFLLGTEAAGGASYTLTTTEDDGWRWTPGVLTSTRVGQLAGQQYHILVAFSTGQATTGVYLRAVVEAHVGSAIPLAQTGLTQYNGEGLVDLGVLPLPPGGYDEEGANISLAINAFRPTGGGASMTVDFVALFPAGDGLFQRLRVLDFTIAASGMVVADGLEDRAYYDGGGGVHTPIVRKRSNPLLLFPGQYNRVRILFNETPITTGFVAGRHFQVSAGTRTRKLDI